jgi:hypothetical protein
MTSTPDDQDWLHLAEEAFGDFPDDEATQSSEHALWRYRSPVA